MDSVIPKDEEYTEIVDTTNLGERLTDFKDKVSLKVFGQDRAIEHGVRRLAVYEAGLNDPTKPVGAMIFAGGTGVGKTWGAKVMAAAWIGGKISSGRSPAVIIE